MPAVYQDYGIRFMFPENWKLDVARHGRQLTVSLESQKTGFWSITLYDRKLTPETVATDALRVMSDEYPGLDVEDVTDEIGAWPAVGHNLNFFCLDLTNTCSIRAFRTPEHTALVLYQVTDEELDELRPVFRAICASMKAAET